MERISPKWMTCDMVLTLGKGSMRINILWIDEKYKD